MYIQYVLTIDVYVEQNTHAWAVPTEPALAMPWISVAAKKYRQWAISSLEGR